MQDKPTDADATSDAVLRLPAEYFGAVTVDEPSCPTDSQPTVIALLLELDPTSPVVSEDTITYSLVSNIFVGSPDNS